jgi:hypothetical protein
MINASVEANKMVVEAFQSFQFPPMKKKICLKFSHLLDFIHQRPITNFYIITIINIKNLSSTTLSFSRRVFDLGGHL